MKLCFSMDPLTIDPRKNGDFITSTLHYMIFDGLVHMNCQGDFELALAKRVEVFNEGKTYEFTLRDTCWSNGDPILAQDFERSWKGCLDPHCPIPWPQLFFFLQNGEKARKGLVDISEVGVRAIGLKTLRIDLENPCPHFFALLSLCNVFPAPSMLDHPADLTDVSKIPISGPFRIISWKKREEIYLQKNPFYWNAKNVSLQELKIFICPNPYGILNMFKEKQIDLISNIYCSLPTELIEEHANHKFIKLTSIGATAFCSFNNSLFPFNNKNIRKAFSFSIRREEIAASFEIPAERLLPPPLSKGVAKCPIHYDRQEARHFFKLGMHELGIFEEGNQEKLRAFFNQMVLHFEHSISRTKVARMLQKQWKECLGIQVQLAPISYQEHIQRFYTGDYSMQIGHWISQYMDPISILERFKDQNIMKNYPRFKHSRYSALMNKINGESDPSLRGTLILKAEELLTEEIPLTPLYHYSQVVATHTELQGITYLQNGALSFTAGADNEEELRISHRDLFPMASGTSVS